MEDGRDLKRAKWTQTKGKEGMERDGSFCIRQEGEDSKGKWKGASVTNAASALLRARVRYRTVLGVPLLVR